MPAKHICTYPCSSEKSPMTLKCKFIEQTFVIVKTIILHPPKTNKQKKTSFLNHINITHTTVLLPHVTAVIVAEKNSARLFKRSDLAKFKILSTATAMASCSNSIVLYFKYNFTQVCSAGMVCRKKKNVEKPHKSCDIFDGLKPMSSHTCCRSQSLT